MQRLEKTEYDLIALMEKFSINRRILAQLLGKSREAVGEWVKDGMLPTKYLTALHAITDEKAEKARTWFDCDLDALREALGITYAKLAIKLKASRQNLTTWRRDGRVPRDRLKLVRKLERQIANSSSEKGAA